MSMTEMVWYDLINLGTYHLQRKVVFKGNNVNLFVCQSLVSMQVLSRNQPGKQEVYNIIKVIEEHNFFSIGEKYSHFYFGTSFRH